MSRWGQGVRKKVLNCFMHDDVAQMKIVFNSSEFWRQFIYGRWQWEVIQLQTSLVLSDFSISDFDISKEFLPPNCPFTRLARNPNKLLFSFIWSAIKWLDTFSHKKSNIEKLSFTKRRKIYSFEIGFQSFFCEKSFLHHK